jgi:hypothetical protein
MRSSSLRVLIATAWLAGCRTDPPASSTEVEVGRRGNSAQPSTSPEAAAPEPTPTEPTPTVPACTVERIHSGDHPSHLAVDSTHLYFVQGSALHRIARTGGVPEVVVEDVSWAAPVVRDQAIYTCRNGANLRVDLLRLGKDGSPPQVIAQPTNHNCQLAVLGEHVYFPDRDASWQTWLARVPISGGAVEQLVQLERSLDGLLADDSHVYFRTEADDIRRFDPNTRKSELLVERRTDTSSLGLTDTHVVWMEHSNLLRMPKHGTPGVPELVVTFQDALEFTTDGPNLYWASVVDQGWRRLAPDGKSLVSYAVPAGSSSIVVDGTRVWWTEFTRDGGIFTLDTRGCGDDVLVPTPTTRAIAGPDEEARLRLGHGDGGTFTVQVRDLSHDEFLALQLLEGSHGDGPVPVGTKGLPPRFSVDDAWRVATTRGVFDAQLTGFEIQQGGEGMLFYLLLKSESAGDGRALVSKSDGPKLAELRDARANSSAIATYLPAIREAFTAAGLEGDRILAEHLTVVRGELPAPHVALISVTVPNSNEEMDNYVSALLLGDSAGAISGTIYAPQERWDAFTIDYLVDLGADGVDEVGFTSAYYEGSYELLLEWDGAEPRTSTLAGDGA